MDVADRKVAALVDPARLVMIAWLFEKLRKLTDNPPHVIVQKDDAGVAQVVAIEQPSG